jgi:hypothetical protein
VWDFTVPSMDVRHFSENKTTFFPDFCADSVALEDLVVELVVVE